MALITRNRSLFLRDVFVALLPHVRCSVTAKNDSWYRVLTIVLNRKSNCFTSGNPIRDVPEESFYSEIPMLTKLDILHYLCEWILEESSLIAAVMKERKDEPLFSVSDILITKIILIIFN